MKTIKAMLATGEWAKDGKNWKHVSGAEIRYDCNRFGWEFNGRVYKTLEAARVVFEWSRK